MDTPDIPYKNLFREDYIKKNFPDFYNKLALKYPNIVNYKERVYLYIHGWNEPPRCPTCGNYKKYRNSPAGYGKYCDRTCINLEEKNRKTKKTKLERYGDESYNNRQKSKKTNLDKYGVTCTLVSESVKEKVQKTNIERYGVDNPFKSEVFQQKARNTKTKKYGEPNFSNPEKRRSTCLERYGADNAMKNTKIQEKFISTMRKKYGVRCAMLNQELKQKCTESIKNARSTGKYNETHKQNNSFNTSNIEREFEKYLIDLGIKYEYQYRSKEYPFECDFYFPDLNLYLEIQGTWTHGEHPFDENNPNDKKMVEFWKSKNTKYYNQAIYVWTNLDVKKRKLAETNNLNFLEIFSINLTEVIQQFEEYANRFNH